MRRYLTCHVVVFLLCAAPVFAQTKAKAQNVPEIPYESVPNFLKLPPGLYLGEAHRRRDQFQGTRLRLHAQRATRACSSSTRTAPTSARSARAATASSSRTACASIRRTTSGSSTRGRTWSSSSIPQGRVVMVLGRRPEAGRPAPSPHTAARRRPPRSTCSAARPTSRGIRRATSSSPTATSIIAVVKYDKNGRFLKQVGSEQPGPSRASSTRRTAIAVDAQGNVYVADRGNKRMQVFDNNLVLRRRSTTTSAISWTVCISPGPHQYLFTSNSNPERQHARARGTSPARSTRWSWTARSSASSAMPASSSAGSRSVHMMDCRNPNEIFVAEIESWRVQKIMLKPQGAPKPTTTAAR